MTAVSRGVGQSSSQKLDQHASDKIYDQLHDLRRYRNKIHIQDDLGIKGVSRDEGTSFSPDICSWASTPAVQVLKYLSERLARPEDLRHYVQPLAIPRI
jgi:hypothetical protein